MMYCGQFGSMIATRSPFADSEPRQRRGEGVGACLDVAKRQLGAEEHRGTTVGNIDDDGVEDVAQRPAWIRHPRRHPVVVVTQPRSGVVHGPVSCASSRDRQPAIDDDDLPGDVV